MDLDEFTPCDTCGVRSFVFAFLPSGGQISLCGHHGVEGKPKLDAIGAFVIDNRADILA